MNRSRGIALHNAYLGRRVRRRDERYNPAHIHGNFEAEYVDIEIAAFVQLFRFDVGYDSSNAHRLEPKLFARDLWLIRSKRPGVAVEIDCSKVV